MVIFESKQKKFEGDLRMKLCGNTPGSVKYLGLNILFGNTILMIFPLK